MTAPGHGTGGPLGLRDWYVSRGRIGRSTWWLRYALPILLLTLLATAADLAFGYAALPELAAGGGTPAGYDPGPFTTLVALLTLVPSISSNVTRLHDRGLAAWWLLLVLVPFFGAIVLFVLFGLLRGDGGPNRYGPPPSPSRQAADGPLYPPAAWS